MTETTIEAIQSQTLVLKAEEFLTRERQALGEAYRLTKRAQEAAFFGDHAEVDKCFREAKTQRRVAEMCALEAADLRRQHKEGWMMPTK